MRKTVIGAVIDIEEAGGHVHAAIAVAGRQYASCAAVIGSTAATALIDAHIHSDQVAVVIDRRGIDLDNPHDQTPSAIATMVDVTWRVPRLGQTAGYGAIDNVVHFEPNRAASAEERRRTLLAAA